MLSIGELAARLGVATHVLRYWETRFAQLKPLQRSGRRRYYRPADVALATRIHHLLHEKGFTVEGARKALAEAEAQGAAATAEQEAPSALPAAAPSAPPAAIKVEKLVALRDRLAAALER
ncbi:MerR family transcriptional regulator [Sphingopyxis sp. MWB1]|uniref:MerR family transcriptional regulator n=1 Tax=Sphingopyxis sp. MWB1 TaxID=1537715 RepID=UPI00051A22DC|nr:MerR family transcriptional regulator [Sphingopyxis sp. MWB1]